MATPTHTLHSVNFDHEPKQFATFTETVRAAKERGFEAIITDGLGVTLATWSPIHGLRMRPNKYSA